MSENKPFVSVIIPLFNDEHHVGKAISALLKQTYPKNNYEIIVVDNGSSDNSKLIVSSFPIILLEEKIRRSSYAARNKGISFAKGDVIAFTDSDCQPCAEWIQEGVKAIENTGADMAAGIINFDFSITKKPAEYYDAVMNIQNEECVEFRKAGNTANLFVKRKVFENIGIFPEEIQSGGDIYFTTRATSSGFSIVYASGAIVWHPTRSLLKLLQKAFRVGKGKNELKRVPGSKKIKGWERKNSRIWEYFDARLLFYRLKKHGYNLGYFKSVQILIIFYLVLIVNAAGRLSSHHPK